MLTSLQCPQPILCCIVLERAPYTMFLSIMCLETFTKTKHSVSFHVFAVFSFHSSSLSPTLLLVSVFVYISDVNYQWAISTHCSAVCLWSRYNILSETLAGWCENVAENRFLCFVCGGFSVFVEGIESQITHTLMAILSSFSSNIYTLTTYNTPPMVQ